MEPERHIPALASQSFKEWFHRRSAKRTSRGAGGKTGAVVLWPDTFNNYFHPWVAQAAVEVLEDAGFEVIVPKQDMCCGRPLYDYGMLKTAEKWLRRILDKMRPQIEAGIPFVLLEPSCAAVFRDELTNLMPHDQDAQRLRQQTFLLSEFLQKYAPQYPNRQLDRKALVHAHCHQRAIMGLGAEEAVLRRAGLDYHLLDSGCCGMAGAFGFEKGEHYEVSVKCGERVLLPAVRRAAAETLIITNGFSCHEQILQLANRKASHLAEVLQMTIREGKLRPPSLAEAQPDGHAGNGQLHKVRGWAMAAASLAIAGAAGVFWVRQKRKHPHKRIWHKFSRWKATASG